ncbi:hypothetical protein AB1E18_011927 [Capra hircus]
MSLLPPPGHLRGTSSSSPKEESSEPGKLIFNSETRNVASQARLEEERVSAPRFDKIPWFSEASFMNKPLVLSLPKRYPHSSATFLVASKKDMNLPILFQVPDVLSKARWNQNDPTLIRNKQLCSTCRDVKMVQPKTLIIPDDLKQSFANIMNHRMMSLHPPKAQTVPKRSCDDILTENVHYRLPILGPRTAVFHGLLSDAYETLRETELSSLPSKEPVSKAVNQ